MKKNLVDLLIDLWKIMKEHVQGSIITILTITDIVLALIGIQIWIFNVGVVLLSIGIAHIILSLGKVNFNEIAYMFFWGRPIKPLKQGPYIAMLGLFQVEKELRTYYQDELPGEPEQIYTGDGQTPKGMFLPIRIKFGQPDPALVDDPYNQPMVVEVTPVVQWYVVDRYKFGSTIGDVPKCKKSLADKAIEVLNDRCAKISPAKALLELDDISNKYQEKLRTETAAWGIEIQNAFVKPFNFSHKLNIAVIGVATATQDAKKTIIDAEASKTAGVKNGEMKSQVEGLILAVQRLNIDELGKLCKGNEGAQFALWLQTLQKTYENANYSLIPGSELFTAVGGLQEMLKKLNINIGGK